MPMVSLDQTAKIAYFIMQYFLVIQAIDLWVIASCSAYHLATKALKLSFFYCR